MPGDNEIHVENDKLEAVSTSLGQATQRIGEILAGLDDDVQVLRSSWTGAASNAYDHAQSSWRRDIDEIKAALSRFSVAVSDSRENFRQVEAANEREWQ